MKHYHKLMKEIALLGLTVSLVFSLSTTAMAKHRMRHYRYNTSYFCHHHKKHRHTNKRRHHHILRLNQMEYNRYLKKSQAIRRQQLKLKRTEDQGSNLTNAIRDNLFADINQTRLKFHRSSLKPVYWLQEASNYRAPYVQYAYENYDKHSENYKAVGAWVHGYDTHVSLIEHLYRKHRVPSYSGENVCDYTVGNPQYQSDNTLARYDNNTASGVAANIDNNFMYHDMAQGNNNGHRKNELNRHYRYLAVSVRYNSSKNYGTITEDYAS